MHSVAPIPVTNQPGIEMVQQQPLSEQVRHWRDPSKKIMIVSTVFAVIADLFFAVAAILIIIGAAFIVTNPVYYSVTGANIFVAGDLLLFLAGLSRIVMDTSRSISIARGHFFRVMCWERFEMFLYLLADLGLTIGGLLFFIGACLVSYPLQARSGFAVWDAGIAFQLLGATFLILADVGILFQSAAQPKRLVWVKYWMQVVSALWIFFSATMFAVGTSVFLFIEPHWLMFGSICWIIGCGALLIAMVIRLPAEFIPIKVRS